MSKNKKIKKLDIDKVLFVPVYRRENDDLMCTTYIYDNRWAAIYKKKSEYGSYYDYVDILDDFKEIKPFGHGYGEEFLVNTKNSIRLQDILQHSKYKHDDIKQISYTELLYIIKPIVLMLKQNVVNAPNKKAIFYPNDSCINYDVYIYTKNGFEIENRLIEPHEYYAIDVETGNVISYDFIHKEIPFIPKNSIKNMFNCKVLKKGSYIKEFLKKLR